LNATPANRSGELPQSAKSCRAGAPLLGILTSSWIATATTIRAATPITRIWLVQVEESSSPSHAQEAAVCCSEHTGLPHKSAIQEPGGQFQKEKEKEKETH
jgi:hypothetical protein